MPFLSAVLCYTPRARRHRGASCLSEADMWHARGCELLELSAILTPPLARWRRGVRAARAWLGLSCHLTVVLPNLCPLGAAAAAVLHIHGDWRCAQARGCSSRTRRSTTPPWCAGIEALAASPGLPPTRPECAPTKGCLLAAVQLG